MVSLEDTLVLLEDVASSPISIKDIVGARIGDRLDETVAGTTLGLRLVGVTVGTELGVDVGLALVGAPSVRPCVVGARVGPPSSATNWDPVVELTLVDARIGNRLGETVAGTTLELSQSTQFVFSGEFKKVHFGQRHS